MSESLNEIAKKLKDNGKKVQLIYAFNGTGKTRLSREFKNLVSPKDDEEVEETGLLNKKISLSSEIDINKFISSSDKAISIAQSDLSDPIFVVINK